MYKLSTIDTVIFDLGQVIVDLDAPAVVTEFARLTKGANRDFKELLEESSYLFDYEVGKLTDQEFVEAANLFWGAQISEDEFRYAWNLMIKSISIERLRLMEKLMTTHKVLILSNTNAMHELYFDGMVRDLTGRPMSDYAHTAYYSHRIGYRKPNEAIYRYIIEEQGLSPQKALFLDDKPENIMAARNVGLLAEQVKFPDQIFELLADE